MPLYEYKATGLSNCVHCAHGLTVLQKISDPPLTQCQHCQGAVKKIISAPNVHGALHSKPSTQQIEKAGFTQYRRLEKGVYEKTAGRGPALIQDKPQR